MPKRLLIFTFAFIIFGSALLGAAVFVRLHGLDIHRAAMMGDAGAVRHFLRIGADPNTRDSQGATPLHTAARWDKPKVVSLLLQKGADPNVRDRNGSTPLAVATRHHSRAAVAALRSHGAHL